jgi:SagB-type dehydrogenase family enzyme
MRAHRVLTMGTATAMVLLSSSAALAQIALPRPHTEGGMPLMEALSKRTSTREYSPASLSPQLLSDLLWAAAGINRPESGKRTAPSARDLREVDVYVATAEGIFSYDAAANALQLVASGDQRAATGSQPFVREAAVNLIYVADHARLANVSERDRVLYPAISAGAMVQNVYLFAASAGLASVVRAMVDRAALAEVMKLRPEQQVVICQTVGMPAGR